MKAISAKNLAALSVSLSLAFAAALPCQAGKGIEIKNLELYPTFECIGLRLAYAGDEDSTASAGVRYRKKGTNNWRSAHPLSRIKANRFAGSIFFLSPGTTYQVEVTVTDSGGVSGGMKIVQVTTRSDRFPIGSGREYYVDPSGDDSNKGTNSKPFRTIQKGADFARPGDIVWVMPGMYREEVMVTRSGKKDSYIAFIARGKGVVISGADPGYENLQKPGNWQLEQGDVYSTNPGYMTRYVAADGQRLYHYRTKGEFEEFICGEPGGWYQDEATGRLYVRLSSGENLNSHVMQVACLDTGIHLKEADHVLIDGFEIRDYGSRTTGAGIHLDGSAWCVLRNCSIHGMNSKVLLTGGVHAEGNLVEDCELWDTSIPLWPWAMTIGHDESGGGVMSTGGRGNVVRGCRMHGLFDGLAPSYWDSLWVEAYNCDWDVYDNEIYDLRDDAVEPEGPCINFRFWNNYCHDLFTGISLAPINVGPAFIMYNVLYDENWLSLKYGKFRSEETGKGLCYFYHNTIYSKKPKVNTFVVSRPLAGQIFRNNIIYATAYAFWTSKTPLATNDIDYNDWYSSDTDWFEMWTGTRYKRLFHFSGRDIFFLKDLQEFIGWEMHGLNADPLFIDPESGDLGLKAGSPCIDNGVVLPNINDGYYGEAPDMGAYERGSTLRRPFPLGLKPGR